MQPLQIKPSVFCTVEEAAQGRFCPSKHGLGKPQLCALGKNPALRLKINEPSAIYLGSISVSVKSVNYKGKHRGGEHSRVILPCNGLAAGHYTLNEPRALSYVHNV